MPTTTAKKTAAKTSSRTTKTATASSKKRTASGASDALQLLIADHKEVKQLFKAYDKLVDAEAADDEKQALAEKICALLTIHATIEEELFYPAARVSLDEDDLLDEAEVEHASAKDLIAQIQGMKPSDDLYDAKVTVLGEYIDHHVKEEEDEMFPKAKKSDLDLQSLGEDLKARKEELMSEMGLLETAEA
ncbi:MAG: hemerythrin domain-containing protein [Rubrivivax sp.]|nr:MAG: hemerythrin domain-containing protein [Rubrivivax sp.]